MIPLGYSYRAKKSSRPQTLSASPRWHGLWFRPRLRSLRSLDRPAGAEPFVWSVLGAIAQAMQRLTVGTAVTCPSMRIHPAIIAQAAATTATLLPGRFFLGVGTGENLNEQVVGQGWPETEVRQERLEEAIEIIRRI
jgi:G6PDH family F420-dependent oxidoreductase